MRSLVGWGDEMIGRTHRPNQKEASRETFSYQSQMPPINPSCRQSLLLSDAMLFDKLPHPFLLHLITTKFAGFRGLWYHHSSTSNTFDCRLEQTRLVDAACDSPPSLSR